MISTCLVRVGSGVVWMISWRGLSNTGTEGGESFTGSRPCGSNPGAEYRGLRWEVGECIDRVEAVDIVKGERVTIDAETCRFSYRDSIFKHEWKNRFLVTYVTFRLAKYPEFRLHYGSVKDEVNRLGELSLKIDTAGHYSHTGG